MRVSLPERMVYDIHQFLTVKDTRDANLLYLCFVLMDEIDHDAAMEAVPRLKSRLPVKEGSVLLFKLTTVMPDVDVNAYGEQYEISLLEYALTVGSPYIDKVRHYITTVPFGEWPIEDKTLNQRLIKFLDGEPPVCIKDFDLLDDPHWRFVIKNSRYFNLTGVPDYIRAHPRKFAKIDVSPILPPQSRNFVFSMESACILPTASLFLRRGVFVNSISLVHSFFAHASSPISADIFQRYLEIAVSRSLLSFLRVLLQYSCRTGVAIESFDFGIFFTDSLFELTLKCLRRFQSLSALPSVIAKRIGGAIGHKIEPSLIHDPGTSAHLIRLDPPFFLSYVLSPTICDERRESDEFRAHDFLPLLPLLLVIPFDVASLTLLIRKHIDLVCQTTSLRKRRVFFRFLSNSLVCAQGQARRAKRDVDEHIAEVANAFERLASGVFNGFYEEARPLLENLTRLLQEAERFDAFFATLSPGQLAFSLFLSPMAAIAVEKRETLSEADLHNAAQLKRPAQKAHFLKAGYILASQQKDHGFMRIGRKLLPSVVSHFLKYSKCFVCGPLAICLFGRMVMSSKADEVDQSWYTAFRMAFIRSSALPTFKTSLFLFGHLTQRLPGLFEQLLKSDFFTPELLNAIDNSYRTRKAAIPSAKQELFDVETLESFQRYFAQFPTKETCDFLYRLGLRSRATACLFFVKLPNTVRSFLPVFTFLTATYNRLTPDAKRSVEMAVKAAEFIPKSRQFAMGLVAPQPPEDRQTRLILVAAETDDLDGIKMAISHAIGRG
jgi:hypothetical protein